MCIKVDIIKKHPHEMIDVVKKTLCNVKREVFENNLSSFEYLFKEIKRDYHKDKCDICYLYTFTSANLLSKTHLSFFSKLLFSYAQLYCEKNEGIRSLSVIIQYIQLTTPDSLEHYSIGKNVTELKDEVVSHFFENFYTFIKIYPTNINMLFNSSSFDLFSNTKQGLNFFLLLIQCLSISSMDDNNNKDFPNTIDRFILYYQNNIKEIKKSLYDNPKQFETFIRVMAKLTQSIMNHDNFTSSLFTLGKRLLLIIIDCIIDDSINNTIVPQALAFSLIISNMNKIALIISTKKLKDNDYVQDLDCFIRKALKVIEDTLRIKQNNKTLKLYSSLLGKAVNIYSNLDNIENRNNYSMMLVQMYKQYKYPSVDLLLVKVNMFKLFITDNNNSNTTLHSSNYYDLYNNHITELEILINAILLEDKNDQENFIEVNCFLLRWIENSLFFEVQKNNTKPNDLYEVINHLHNVYTSINSHHSRILPNDFGVFVNMLKILLLTKEDQMQITVISLNKLFSEIANEKVISIYNNLITYYLSYNNHYTLIRFYVKELSTQANIKWLIDFYSKVLYYLGKFKHEEDLKIQDNTKLQFLYDSMKIMTLAIESKCTSITYKDIKTLYEDELLQHLYLTIRLEYNREIKLLDIAYNNPNNKSDKDKTFTAFFINLFRNVQRLINLNETVMSLLLELNNDNLEVSYNSIDYYCHIDILINIILKLKSLNQKYLILLIINPQVLDDTIKDKSTLLLIKMILISLVKYSLNEVNIAEEYQETIFNKELINLISNNNKEALVLKEDKNKNHDKSTKKNNSYFKYKHLLNSYSISFDNQLIDQCIQKQLSKQSHMKIDYVINQNIIKHILEQNVVLGKEHELSNDDIVIQLLDINITIIQSNALIKNADQKAYQILLNCLLLYKTTLIPIAKSYDDYILRINDLLKEVSRLQKTRNIKSFIGVILLINLLTTFYYKYHTIIVLSAACKEIKTTLLLIKDTLLVIQKTKSLNIYEYIIYLEISFLLYSMQIKDKTISMKESISQGKTLLEEAISIYKNLLKESIKGQFDEIEIFKTRVLQSFLGKYRYDDNSLLSLMYTIDYQMIIIDTVKKISLLSQEIFTMMNNYGFCDIIIKLLYLNDQVNLLSYNYQFNISTLKMMIKIMRNYDRKLLYDIHNDQLGFNSHSDYNIFMHEVFINYFALRYNLNKKEINSLIETRNDLLEENITKITMRYDIKDIIVDKFFHKTISLREVYHCNNDIKSLSTLFKYQCLYTSGRNKEDNRVLQELFEGVFFHNEKVSPDGMIMFYINHLCDVHYKRIIKFIPYFYHREFIDIIITNQGMISTILEKCRDSIINNNNDFTIIKHIKKVITELIYFTTKNNEQSIQSKQVILFYIKYLLNFKYILYCQKTIKYDNNNESKVNLISLFRIKKIMYLCINYHNLFAYNKIDLSNEETKNSFTQLKDAFQYLSEDFKVLHGRIINIVKGKVKDSFQLIQNTMIISCPYLTNILIQILNDNKTLDNYINKKIIKYSFTNQTKDDIIKGLLNPNENITIFKQTKSKRINNSNDYIPKFRKKLYGESQTKMSLYDESQGLFYYIPSSDLSKLPVESLPIFFKWPITRVINYNYITNPQKEEMLLSTNDIFCLLNPAKDLKDSEKLLTPFLQNNHIDSIIGEEPTNQDLETRLHDKKIFLYCGHGDATKYLSMSYIKNNMINFMSFLFGCSSANVSNYLDKDTQPFGLPQYYQMNSCPFFLGFLWPVTSFDIDNFAMNIFKLLFEHKRLSLIEVILICKAKINKNFNASSLVLYSAKDIHLTLREP